MPKLIMYLLIAMCLLGQVLATKHKRSGYVLWVIADLAWAVFNFSQYKIQGAIEQGILWTMYFIISLWGFMIYKKDKNEK
jgi:nicotinamide riboside transporter PnuC